MNTLFYKELKDCHYERINQERILKQSLDYQAELQYCLFKIWCKVYKNSLYTESNFEEYLNTEKEISFWIKKRIYENFF